MERTLKKKKNISLILLIAMAVFLLIPATGAVASALSGHYFIGLSGVTGGNPSIGMYGSSVHQGIGFDDWHININPASPAGSTVLLIPLIFLAAFIFLMLSMLFSGKVDLKVLIWAAVLIIIAFVLLSVINIGTHGLLGM